MDDLIVERSITGCVDLYGYHADAGGWLFIGWVAQSGVATGPVRIDARFSGGSFAAAATAMFFNRTDVQPFGIGMIVFVRTDQEDLGSLKQFRLEADAVAGTIALAKTVRAASSDRIRSALNEILAQPQPLGDGASMVSLIEALARPGEIAEREPEFHHRDRTEETTPASDGNTHPAGSNAQPRPEQVPAMASASAPAVVITGSGEFDEERYLQDNPEVVAAIARGQIPSALFHYRLFGRRRQPARSSEPSPATAEADPEPAPKRTRPELVLGGHFGPASVDAVITSTSNACFVVGWADDRRPPIVRVAIEYETGAVLEWPGDRLVRFRRADAETALGIEQAMHLGFCGLLLDEGRLSSAAIKPRLIRLVTADGTFCEFPLTPRIVDDTGLRDIVLGYLSALDFAGNKHVEYFYALDPYMGAALVRQNRIITRSIVGAATFERFDGSPRRFKGSIIVCLYGKPEFQFVQNALFSADPGARDYEYIYVSNSPEMLETLCKTASISKQIYGLNVTIVMLPGNAGFGAANNVAARYARSDRIMIVNPDVFPRDRNWARRHDDIVHNLPREQTRLFAPRLFYADGSLMHAGMHLAVDWGISISGIEIRRRPMLRVEHYGKGAPAKTAEFLGSRPVPAVSGAFISLERDWFERLGGFAEDYIFGHYEDADLCLRSIEEGVVPWMHDLDFWHLEGKGSTRLPHHVGASVLNRWLFTREWYDRVSPHLVGRVTPTASKALPEEPRRSVPARNAQPHVWVTR